MNSATPESLVVNFNPSKYSEGVYIHSKATNADFYDLMWNYQRSADHSSSWGENRIPKFLQFLGGEKFWPRHSPIVLDMACGLGRFSVASLELGAGYVVACDGSYVGPKYVHDLVLSNQVPNNQALNNHKWNNIEDRSFFGQRLLPIQVDIEKISECFLT